MAVPRRMAGALTRRSGQRGKMPVMRGATAGRASSTARKTSEIANSPTITAIRSNPPNRAVSPKVNRGWPVEGPSPTSASR